MNTTRIIEAIPHARFRSMISDCGIMLGSHALDRLSEMQRKVFKPDDLIMPLRKENPALAGLQKNGCHAAYYRRKQGYLKIVFCIRAGKVIVITFMNTERVPRIR